MYCTYTVHMHMPIFFYLSLYLYAYFIYFSFQVSIHMPLSSTKTIEGRRHHRCSSLAEVVAICYCGMVSAEADGKMRNEALGKWGIAPMIAIFDRLFGENEE